MSQSQIWQNYNADACTTTELHTTHDHELYYKPHNIIQLAIADTHDYNTESNVTGYLSIN